MTKTITEVLSSLLPKNQSTNRKFNNAIVDAITAVYNEVVTNQKVELIEEITEAVTLTSDDSGKVFILNAAAGVEVALPAIAAGLKFKFILGAAFITTDWTILSATDVTQGNVLVAGAHVAGSDENTVSFVASAESIGDYVEYVSDGTNWYVSGSGVTAGSITLTTA
jgi:hypothetical protein